MNIDLWPCRGNFYHFPALCHYSLFVCVVVIVLIRRLQDYTVQLSCSDGDETHSAFGDIKGAKSSAWKASVRVRAAEWGWHDAWLMSVHLKVMGASPGWALSHAIKCWIDHDCDSQVFLCCVFYSCAFISPRTQMLMRTSHEHKVFGLPFWLSAPVNPLWSEWCCRLEKACLSFVQPGIKFLDQCVYWTVSQLSTCH